MILEELVETNGHIGLIEADVRGTDQSESELLCTYRVGPRAGYYQCDGDVENYSPLRHHSVYIINDPIHVRDNGASSFQFGAITRNIPREIRRLEVTHWNLSTEYGAPSGNSEMKHLSCDLRATDTLRKSEMKKRAEAYEEWRQGHEHDL